jgi:transposase
MTNYREILRLHSLGINKVDIAASCSCSRNTVASVLKRAKEVSLSYPLPDDMSDKQIEDKLFPHDEAKPTYKIPDYKYVHREMAKSGVTLTLLWLEYCDSCRESGEIPYKSTQFNKYYNDYLKTTNATMHISHKPGEIMQVDWAGDVAHVVDTDTGELIPAYVFVSTLPYSGYSYVEAFFSMEQECWIAAHVNAFKYFGGVTRIIQCDNLKTGVDKHTRSEVMINKNYQEMAEHYGTAIIPCRVRAPKDKAYVEGTVGIISTYILAALRNQQFLSLAELNESVHERLELFNNKPFQKKDGSRAIAFAEEKLFLLALPQRQFELSKWKIATVGPNYHVSIDNQNYSVSYEYIKQKVDVRLTKNIIEVFFDGNRICSHPRLYGRFGQYSTMEAHMPPNHQKYIAWNGERFIHWAEKIGENTTVVVRFFLSRYKVEQQGYKSCMALLTLADKYSAERLEVACTRTLSYTQRPDFKGIQAILQSGQDKIKDESATIPSDTTQYGFTRGAEYYRSNKLEYRRDN